MIAPSDTGIYGRLHMGPNYEMAPAQGFTPVGRRCFALLKPESDVREIFPHGPAPVRQAAPILKGPTAEFPAGLPLLEVDVARCTAEQVDEMARYVVRHCAAHAAQSPAVIAAAIRKSGVFPVHASHFSAVVVVELSGGRRS